MADNFKWVQAQPFQLAGSGAALGATSIVLQTFKDIDGTNLAMTDFGTLGFITMEPGSGTQEEAITFSGVTQNANGTATLTGIKTQLFKFPLTQTSGLSKSHAGGTSVILTNSAGFYENIPARNNDETISGLWNFPNNGNTPTVGTVYAAPTLDLQIPSKKYVDTVAISGAPDANTTTKGIVQLPTQAQVDARTSTGSTGASLTPTPANLRTVLTHDYVASATGNDSYAITCTPTVTAYTVGDIYTFGADVANTGAATLAVNGLVAKPILKAHDQVLNTGDIEAGQIVTVVYDGTNMQMQSQPAITQATIRQVQDSSTIYAATATGNDTYVITLTPTLPALVTGQMFNFKTDVGNTGAATLNIDSLGPITIKKLHDIDLATGDIEAGQIVTVLYDGTNFQMQSQLGQSTASYVTAPQSNSSATAQNFDLVSTTTFIPKTITIYYWLHGIANSTAAYTSGVATWNGTTITSNYIIANQIAAAGTPTGTGFDVTASAPSAGTAAGGSSIVVGLDVIAVTATSFTVRTAYTVALGGTGDAKYYAVATA